MGAFLTGAVVAISGSVNANIDYNTDNTLIEETKSQSITPAASTAVQVIDTYTVAAGKKAYITECDIWSSTTAPNIRYFDASASTFESILGIYVNDVQVAQQAIGSMNHKLMMNTPIIAVAGDTIKVKWTPERTNTALTIIARMRGVLRTA